jgi:hypothetical protein
MRLLSILPGWPPQGGAGPFDTRKEVFATSPELVTIKSVDRVVNTRIDITCIFRKEVVTFRFFASSKGMAEAVADVIRRNAGQNLRDMGILLVEDSE